MLVLAVSIGVSLLHIAGRYYVDDVDAIIEDEPFRRKTFDR